jgi:hypothetical protein
MSDRKPHKFRPPLYHQGQANGPDAANSPNGPQRPKQGDEETGSGEGWDAYRKWLSRVSGQSARRSPMDGSIYSWKGYHSWADKVRQNWKPE